MELIEPPRQPYARQGGRPDVGVDLFAAFLGRCRGGRLARVHGAAGDIPAVVATGMAGRQRRACPADGQDRHRPHEQQLMRQRPAAWLHAQRYPPG